MAKMGCPDLYATKVEPYLEQIPLWYKTMTVRQIAKKLGISKTTLYKYAGEHEELAAVLDNGKGDLIDDLKCALKQRALGYTYEEITVKETEGGKWGYEKTTTTVTRHMPADPASIHMLLKNLDENWHNDDKATLDMKRKELELKEKRVMDENW